MKLLKKVVANVIRRAHWHVKKKAEISADVLQRIANFQTDNQIRAATVNKSRRGAVSTFLSAVAAGAVIAASPLTTNPALADTAFTSFGFNSLDGSTARTMPSRIADIHNVLDFGADPTGVADSTAAFQACINWTMSQSRGIIFIPPGNYTFLSPVTFNMTGVPSIVITGSGHASSIGGNFPGFLLSRNVLNGPAAGGIYIDRLNLHNSDALGGCLQVSYAISHSVRDCTFEGFRGLVLMDVAGTSDQGSTVDACSFSTNGQINAIAIIIAANGTITNCDMTGFRYGVMAAGVACNIISTRFEVNGFAAGEGSGPAPVGALAGAAVLSGVLPGIRVTAGSSGTTFSVSSVPVGEAIHIGDYIGAEYVSPVVQIIAQTSGPTGGAGDYTLSGTFNIGAGNGINIAQIFSNTSYGRSIGGMTILGCSFESNKVAIDYGPTTGTFVCNCTFQQSLSGGTYGIRTNASLNQGVFCNLAVGVDVSVAAIEVTDKNAGGGERGQLVFINVDASNGGVVNPGGVAWDLTAVPYANVGLWFMCNIQPVWTFSQLPPAGKMFQSEKFFITNAHTATGAWGETVSGAGGVTTASWVVWNGSNWTLATK